MVSWGNHWYEANNQWEVLTNEVDELEFHVESLVQGNLRSEIISLEGMPESDRNILRRLQIETLFLDERTCRITVKDVGFGEFFPATDFQVEKVIHLGGNDGKFNSMSS